MKKGRIIYRLLDSVDVLVTRIRGVIVIVGRYPFDRVAYVDLKLKEREDFLYRRSKKLHLENSIFLINNTSCF
jgi:hypothetical protein